MSNYNRNDAINTSCVEKRDTTKHARNNNHVTQTQSKVILANNVCEPDLGVPKPEPRKRLAMQGLKHALTISYSDQLDNELALGADEPEAKLVKIKYTNAKEELPSVQLTTSDEQHNIRDQLSSRFKFVEAGEQKQQQNKRTSFNETLEDFATNESAGKPTNLDFDDEAEIQGYFEDDDEEGDHDEDDYRAAAESASELANLSRQSMVPLHELIAYYQYIQHADSGSLVSRQSSSASQPPQHIVSRKLNNDESIPDRILEEDRSDSRDIPIVRLHTPKSATDSPVDGETDNNSELTYDESSSSRDKFLSDQSTQQASSDKKRIRANVVLELINSERDFVKHLKDVVEGYLYPARRHPEIFTGDRINTIFANIEQLYEFQRKFLECLEAHIDWEDLTQSQVGQCFLKYEKGFSVYHHYCNNHPNATSELQELYSKPRFVKFFEACRLIQNMIDISLDGFLLTPIQKICKYPLQLTELLKNTDQDHPDYNYVASALESMRNCANVANERKRRIEALADIMSFQEKIENWFGPKLSDSSSILIHSGEVSKMNSHTWSQNVQLFLFDHLLLYCKKDLLKRNCLILRGRISMDFVTEISDADEYKPKKSFKLYCSEQQKWFVFVTKSEKEKDEWIRAFERERNLVESDENEGFQITERELCVARRALQNRKHSRSARYRHKRPDTAIVDQLDMDDANMIMNRTLSLPSCIHPSHVMNFVEDSRVVSNRKKTTTSPSASSRSPMVGSPFSSAPQQQPHQLQQHHHQQQQQQQQTSEELQHPDQMGAPGGWFRKMGSKKLSKSQVYNVNGQTGGQQQHQYQAQQVTGIQTTSISPTNRTNLLATAASIVSDDSAAIKFDQLERRHREHMISEEQARLFRLNNDLPVGQVPHFNRSLTPTSQKSPDATMLRCGGRADVTSANQRHSLYRQHRASSEKQRLTPATAATLTTGLLKPNEIPARVEDLSFQSLKINDRQRGHRPSDEEVTFEATVQLSTGQVVKVREDEV